MRIYWNSCLSVHVGLVNLICRMNHFALTMVFHSWNLRMSADFSFTGIQWMSQAHVITKYIDYLLGHDIRLREIVSDWITSWRRGPLQNCYQSYQTACVRRNWVGPLRSVQFWLEWNSMYPQTNKMAWQISMQNTLHRWMTNARIDSTGVQCKCDRRSRQQNAAEIRDLSKKMLNLLRTADLLKSVINVSWLSLITSQSRMIFAGDIRTTFLIDQ